MRYSYDPETDELNITLGPSKRAILAELGDEVYVKLHPRTKDVLGFTILHFEERFKRGKKGKRYTLPLLGELTLPAPLQSKLLDAS
jgi:uncharacterized protein YuzE